LRNIQGTIVLAGAGKMGGAMLSGWLAQGLAAKSVVVIEPHATDDIRALSAKGVRLNPPVKDVGEVAALVVALKPQAFREAASGLKPFATPSTLVVSIMAGTTIAGIAEASVAVSRWRWPPRTSAPRSARPPIICCALPVRSSGSRTRV
jgi:pyrroline-5-carboxylate reductase